MSLNKVPCNTLVYLSHYYVVDGEVIKAYNESPENVTPERIQELIKYHKNIIVQEGKQINAYFSNINSKCAKTLEVMLMGLINRRYKTHLEIKGDLIN